MILGFAESAHQAQALAAELGLAHATVDLHRFPDGESRLILPPTARRHVWLYRSLDYPNDKLVELLLTARGLRGAGVERLSLIAPYLCYMRQDMAFHAGEVVSQRVIGAFLAELFDDVISVDPHLHRISELAQAIPARHAVSLSAAELFGRYLANEQDVLLLGPDEESAQWVGAIARVSGLDYAVASKLRSGDKAVTIQLPAVAVAGRRIILVDDVASTGHTLAAITRQLLAAGASEVSALVTHALFAGDALAVLRQAGVSRIGSSDSIPHAGNVVRLAPLLARAVREMTLVEKCG